MSRREPSPTPGIGDEVAELIETLHQTERRLADLTAGEVDTVSDSVGRTFLLRRSQERLRQREAAKQAAILNALPAHIALLDNNGRIVSVNDRWRSDAEANTFHGPEIGAGMIYLDVCDSAGQDVFVQAQQMGEGIRSVLRGSPSFSLEYPCHSATEQRWFLLTVTPLDAGLPKGVIVMHSDISERTRAESASRRTTELLQAVVNGTPDLVFVKDLDNRYLLCNDAFAGFVGRPIEEVLGLTDSALFDAEEASNVVRSDLEAIRTGVAMSIEKVRTGTPDARVFQSWKAPYRNEHGVTLGVIGISRDVTDDRRLSAELEAERARLAAVQDVAKIGSWSLDVATMSYEWAEQTHRVCGTDPATFVPTMASVRALIHPDDLAAVLAVTSRSLERPAPVHTVEHRLRQPGGEERIVEQRMHVSFDAAGRAVRSLGTCQDITERRQAERELKESQSLLAMSGRLALIGAWSVELPPTRVVGSDTLALIHEEPPGFSPTVEKAFSYYAPEHVDSIRASFGRCVEDGTPFDVEHEIITARGRRVWVRSIGEAVRDSKGAICRVQGALQDLTERKRAEKELRRVALRLTDTMESIADGFVTLDREWRFTYVNRQAEQLLRVSRELALGNVLWEVIPEALGNDSERAYGRAMGGGGAVAFETVYARSGAWFSVNCYPTEEGISIYFRDETARRAARLRLELLEVSVSQLKDMIVIVEATRAHNANGRRIVFVNEAFLRTTGRTREEVIGQTTHILHGPGTDPLELARVSGAMDRFEPVAAELVNYDKNGTPYWIELDAVPVRLAKEERFSHFVAIQRDITERRRDQDALRDLNAELEARVAARTAELNHAREYAEQANHAKSAFLATMSHEIRTPMNGVIGMIDVLEQTQLRSSQADIVKTVRESAHALLGIVDDVLDFSKIESGQFQIDSEPMDVAAVVEAVCDALGRVAEVSAVTLSLFTDPAIPVQTLGDAARLRQVLLNLIGNAIKFCSGSGRSGRVGVRATLLERGDRSASVTISISDDGIGMDEETLSRLFTPFTQADAGTTRRYGGTGLGLTISRRLVELMGGDITVLSEPGRGSTFAVHLTLPTLPEPASVGAETPKLDGLTCLVLGEAESSAGDLSVYLAHAGALPQHVADPATAVRWLETCPLQDLVVMVLAEASESHDRTLFECRAACRLRLGLQIGFVVIERGGRQKRPRARGADVLSIDGDVLHRAAFLKAVAQAAGLARIDTEPAPLADIDTAPAPLDAPDEARQKRLILIAEDNEINQRVLRKQLALLGFAADVATTGDEALAFLKRTDYALLVTDLHMPKTDGYELTLAIRRNEAGRRHMPIVALTANAVKGEAKRCRDVGMDDYMTKPVQLAHLRTMLHKWVPHTRPVDAELDPRAIARLFPDQPRAPGAPVDLGILTALVGSNPEVIDEMLQAFRRSASRSSHEIRVAIVDGRGSAAADAAHKLRSGARSIGADRLCQVCADIEGSARGRDAGALRDMLPRFDAEMDAVDRFLDAIQADGSTGAGRW